MLTGIGLTLLALWLIPSTRLRLVIPVGAPTNEEVEVMVTMTSTQQFVIGPVSGADAHGNPAPLEDVRFTSSDAALLAVEPEPSGGPAMALVKALGGTGTAQIVVSADARIGEGVSELTGIVDVTILAAEAVTLVVPTGAPEEQPVA